VHAVSVGEVQASAALVRALRARYPAIPLVLTTVTPTAGLSRKASSATDRIQLPPYDLPGSVRRFFDRTRPPLAIILETELWPTLYHECASQHSARAASARFTALRSRYRLLVSLFDRRVEWHGDSRAE